MNIENLHKICQTNKVIIINFPKLWEEKKMEIKKIYEIKERSCGKTKNFLRCTEVLAVSDKQEHGFYSIWNYDEYSCSRNEFLVCIEEEKTYTLINREAEIIHKGIQKGIKKVKKTRFFRIYFDGNELISIGSTTDVNTNNTRFSMYGGDISPISEEWIELKKDNGYYMHKLLIIKYSESLENYINIYCADDLSVAKKIKLADAKVIARFEKSQDTEFIRIIKLDENNFPAKEYLFSVDDGKQMQPEIKKI